MPKITFKHGLKSTMPKLDFREPAITDDTEEVFVGGNTENIQLAKQIDLETTNTNVGQKADKTYVDTVTGDITDLQTTDKSNIVAAVNENTMSLAQNAQQISDLVINVKQPPYNAKSNGTEDDAPAIRAAIAKAVQNGGGTILIPGNGTYLIDTLSGISNTRGDYAFVLDNNIHIVANQGATLKLGDNMRTKAVNSNGAGMFYALSKDRVSVKELKIDMNGANNLVPSGATLTGYSIFFENCTNPEASGNEIINSFGRNAILFGGRTSAVSATGDKGKILNNIIRNGGTSIAGNTNQNDFSAIYCDYTNSVIKGNKIYHDNYPFYYCGGIEIHNDNIVCTENYVEKSFPAVYISSDYSGATLKNPQVYNNTFSNCQQGIYFYGLGDFDNGKIRANIISLFHNTNQSLSAFPVAIIQPVNEGANQSFIATLKISNMNIDGNDISEVFTTNPTTALGRGMMLTSLTNVKITGNTIHHLSSNAIGIYGSPYGLYNVDITANKIVDFGLNNTDNHYAFIIDFSGSSTSPAKTAYDLDGLYIRNNEILQTNTNTDKRGFLINWGASSSISNLTIAHNIYKNITVIKEGAKASSVNITTPGQTSGYEVLPSGIIMQWVRVYYNVIAGTDQTFTLPATFPNNPSVATITPVGGSTIIATTNGITTNAVTVRCNTTNSTLHILVIGY